MDFVNMDIAQEHAQRMNQQAINAVVERANPNRPSRTHCIDCGEEIPEERRQKAPGCERCIDCQEEHEQMELRRG